MSDSIEVVPYEGADDRWDAWIGAQGEATACHLAGWRHVMRDALGHETSYAVAKDPTGNWVGVLPLVHVRSRIFGKYLLSMPFLNDGGPLGSLAARTALGRNAVEEAQRRGVDLLELRSRAPVPGDFQTSDRKITVILPLGPSAEELWKEGLRAKVRSQVRRPMKEGMEAGFGADHIDAFYDVFSHTMRDLGTPVLPKRFFEAIAKHLAPHVTFCSVEHRGRPVAAGCGFLWNGEFEITWAGALREASRMAPNMLLYWSLMEEAIRLGARSFNFGRCSPDSGTHRFKRQWGGEDIPLPWSQWSPDGVTATPSPDSPRYRLAIAVWSRLPVAVTNRIGPPLARILP